MDQTDSCQASGTLAYRRTTGSALSNEANRLPSPGVVGGRLVVSAAIGDPSAITGPKIAENRFTTRVAIEERPRQCGHPVRDGWSTRV